MVNTFVDFCLEFFQLTQHLGEETDEFGER